MEKEVQAMGQEEGMNIGKEFRKIPGKERREKGSTEFPNGRPEGLKKSHRLERISETNLKKWSLTF